MRLQRAWASHPCGQGEHRESSVPLFGPCSSLGHGAEGRDSAPTLLSLPYRLPDPNATLLRAEGPPPSPTFTLDVDGDAQRVPLQHLLALVVQLHAQRGPAPLLGRGTEAVGPIPQPLGSSGPLLPSPSLPTSPNPCLVLMFWAGGEARGLFIQSGAAPAGEQGTRCCRQDASEERCEHSSSAPLVVPCSGQTPEGSLAPPRGTQGCPALPPCPGITVPYRGLLLLHVRVALVICPERGEGVNAVPRGSAHTQLFHLTPLLPPNIIVPPSQAKRMHCKRGEHQELPGRSWAQLLTLRVLGRLVQGFGFLHAAFDSHHELLVCTGTQKPRHQPDSGGDRQLARALEQGGKIGAWGGLQPAGARPRAAFREPAEGNPGCSTAPKSSSPMAAPGRAPQSSTEGSAGRGGCPDGSVGPDLLVGWGQRKQSTGVGGSVTRSHKDHVYQEPAGAGG